jgi:hypothetical protein
MPETEEASQCGKSHLDALEMRGLFGQGDIIAL